MIILHYKNSKHVDFTTGEILKQKRQFKDMAQLTKWLERYGMYIHDTRIEIT